MAKKLASESSNEVLDYKRGGPFRQVMFLSDFESLDTYVNRLMELEVIGYSTLNYTAHEYQHRELHLFNKLNLHSNRSFSSSSSIS